MTEFRGDAMNDLPFGILVCAFLSVTIPLSAAPASPFVKFACDSELKIYKGTTPGSYPLRGIYVEINGPELRVVGAAGFEGTYVGVRSDERMMFLRSVSEPLIEGNLNRINGDLWLVKWSDEKKSNSQMSVSAQCRPYKPLF